ncbi:MAG: hypothetical protein MK226_22985 [Saprospiraceae bacterium]|nr:hypothetical protein [Saprospiraceae bacterium]
MNSPIVNDTFRFVKWLYTEFLPAGYRDFQLDLAMDLKNDCVTKGLQSKMTNQQIEVLSLAALLHNVGCIEGQYQSRVVSKIIARNFLEEKGYFDWDIQNVEQTIEATSPYASFTDSCGQIIHSLKFKQMHIIADGELQLEAIGDVFP